LTFIPVRSRLRPPRETLLEGVRRLRKRKQAEEAEFQKLLKYNPLEIDDDGSLDCRHYTTIECDGDFYVYARHRNHGDDLTDHNVYAVIDGDRLDDPGKCGWCDDLRARCSSNRRF
jgi:hypothetical protein